MSDKKIWKDMCRQLREQGCDIVQPKGRTHLKIYQGDVLVTVMQQSETAPRNYLNKRAELRRKGFKIA